MTHREGRRVRAQDRGRRLSSHVDKEMAVNLVVRVSGEVGRWEEECCEY